ncbi:MAG: polyphosphate kinase 2 [Rhizobiaceae bacterium]|nr:polyphosphate kinase 2 [Rhizobiaceae bacterium]
MKIPDAPIVNLDIDGKTRKFDLDDPKLPDWVKEQAFSSGGYPYEERLKRSDYEATLETLQEELVKLQYWQGETGQRIMVVFEGRDAAGKGGTIGRFRQHLNPRHARTVALSKPSDTERGQWYFQRYVDHFPTDGDMVMYDRSWYNRAGVEPVMGFCSDEQHRHFLEQVPAFEQMIVNDGIILFKFWLNVGREMQLERFHDRRHSPLKVWKLSPIDLKALDKWDDYTSVRNSMFEHTDTDHAPWTVVRTNDKRRARICAIRHLLLNVDYEGRDLKKIGDMDEKILGRHSDLFKDGNE